MSLAPIALFVYNRPQHVHQSIVALQQNELAKSSDLLIFADGSKNSGDLKSVREVREVCNTITGFQSVTIIEQEVNLGLAQSIIAGVTYIVNKYGRIIVLEDDLVVAPYFLEYMNQGLEFYENEENVISIHAYVYPIAHLPETFFLKGADCWGWATWKRGWDLFEPDAKRLLAELKQRHLEREFDFNGAYGYTKMLKRKAQEKNDSWAICWYASAFLQDKLTLYPGRPLVQNKGFDHSGVHCETGGDIFYLGLSNEPTMIKAKPIVEDLQARKAFEQFFISIKPPVGLRIKKLVGF